MLHSVYVHQHIIKIDILLCQNEAVLRRFLVINGPIKRRFHCMSIFWEIFTGIDAETVNAHILMDLEFIAVECGKVLGYIGQLVLLHVLHIFAQVSPAQFVYDGTAVYK